MISGQEKWGEWFYGLQSLAAAIRTHKYIHPIWITNKWKLLVWADLYNVNISDIETL